MGQNAAEPQTDRELLLNLNNKVGSIEMLWNEKIDTLTESIDRLNNTYRELEEKRVVKLEERVDKIDEWRNQIFGGWKLAIIIWSVITVAGLALFKLFFLK